MKRTLTLALALALSACVPATDKGENNGDNNGQCTEDCNENGNAKGAFVSGHLGNYMDCPADGYGGDDASSRGAADFAPCEAGDDSCGGPLNCEGAQMTVRVTNSGAELTSVEVTKVELYSMDGVLLGELPVANVVDASDSTTFDGQIGEGESVDLRIDFQGPADLSQLVADVTEMEREYTESAFVRVSVSLGNGATLTIESEELFVLPMVVT